MSTTNLEIKQLALSDYRRNFCRHISNEKEIEIGMSHPGGKKTARNGGKTNVLQTYHTVYAWYYVKCLILCRMLGTT
jgi:hypothetical protein